MATLTTIIQEQILINGTQEGSQHTATYTGIDNIFKTIGSVPMGTGASNDYGAVLYSTADNTWAGSIFDNDGTAYVRITNITTGSISHFTASNLGSHYLQDYYSCNLKQYLKI